MGNASDVIRTGPPFLTCHRVDDVRCGTTRDDDRSILRQGPVVSGVAAEKGKGRGQHGPVFFHHRRWEFDDLRRGIHPAAVPVKDEARFFITHQQPDLLEDFQRGCMGAFNLFLGKKGGKVDHRILL